MPLPLDSDPETWLEGKQIGFPTLCYQPPGSGLQQHDTVECMFQGFEEWAPYGPGQLVPSSPFSPGHSFLIFLVSLE